MKCDRCGKVIRSKSDRANFDHYRPYCSYHCEEWARLESARIWLDEQRAATKSPARDE